MYSNDSISYLIGRIGFGSASSLPISVSGDHQTGTSGRTFSFFHKLVTLVNIYATVDEASMSEAVFNAHLLQLKTDAVKSTLIRVLDQNKLYNVSVDYSDTITSRPELFDEVIGYTLSVNAIEQMISTSRKNIEERNASLKYDKLKIELEGIRDEYGRTLSKGLLTKLNRAVYQATDIIFPDPIIIKADPVW